MGKLIAICLSEKKGTRKSEVEEVELVVDFGLKDDAHGGNWHRQVSLLGKEEIDDFNARGGKVTYGDFGENLVTENVDYTKLKIDDILKVGNTILKITQFGKECHTRCEIYKRVGDCIMPKHGVFAVVLQGGIIKVNDNIEIIESL